MKLETVGLVVAEILDNSCDLEYFKLAKQLGDKLYVIAMVPPQSIKNEALSQNIVF